MRKNVLFIMMIFILLLMIGCGQNHEEKMDYKEMIYNTELLSLEGIFGDPQTIAVNENKLYLNVVQWESNNEKEMDGENIHSHGQGSELRSKLYFTDIDNFVWTEMPIEVDEDVLINTIFCGRNGEMVCGIENNDSEKGKDFKRLVKYSETGEVLAEKDVTELLNFNEDLECLVDLEGNILVACEEKIYIFDNNLQYAGEINSKNPINGICLTKDGQVICGSMVYENQEVYSQIQILDVQEKKWVKTIKVGDEIFRESGCLISGNKWDFYFQTESGIFGYDINKEKCRELLDYVASNIDADSIYGMTAIFDDRFLGVANEENKGISLYTKVDPKTIPDKKIITYGGFFISDEVKDAAKVFNRKNREYSIEFTEYKNIDKMNADILAGKMPDIIELNNQPIEQYVEKGILEELTQYFNRDSEISESDLIPSVRQAMLIDDKIYFISPEFGVDTIIANAKDVGSQRGYTFEEMKSMLDALGDDVRPFYSNNKEDQLSTFLLHESTNYIDWASGECYYTSQEFKNILEFCNRGTNEKVNYENYWVNMSSDIQNGEEVFVNTYGLGLDEIQAYQTIFGSDIAFIGYPDSNRQSSSIRFEMPMGISAQSNEKEGAWEFIRSFMTREYQGNSGSWKNGSVMNPTRQDCFDMLIEARTATEPYTNELGQEVEPTSFAMEWNDIKIDMKPLGQDAVNKYVELVKDTEKRSSYNASVEDIILDEAKAYFHGDRSLDETAEIIQNRIQTYVNEIR